MTLHPLRILLKVFLLLLTGLLASCSKPGPAVPAPSAVPAAAPLPVLGELPDLHLTDARGGEITTASLLGKPLLLWFHHPVVASSTEQGGALSGVDPAGRFRKIVLVPMPALLAPVPQMTLPFAADVAPCPPAVREALGNLRAIPTVLLVDARGRIRLRQEGRLDPAALTAAIQSITQSE